MLTTDEQKDLIHHAMRILNLELPVPIHDASEFFMRLLYRSYPMRPRLVKIRFSEKNRYAWRCPFCNEIIGDVTDEPEAPDRHDKFCRECGQRIDQEEAYNAYAKARGVQDLYSEEIGEILREAEEETRGNTDE